MIVGLVSFVEKRTLRRLVLCTKICARLEPLEGHPLQVASEPRDHDRIVPFLRLEPSTQSHVHQHLVGVRDDKQPPQRIGAWMLTAA